MSKIINVAIWKGAPFVGAISRSIELLNSFIENKYANRLEEETKYQLMDVDSDGPYGNPDIYIIDGGADISPEYYNEKNKYSYCNPTRDRAEFKLAQIYRKNNIRLSGICRGHQLLNVLLGGDLYQDIYRDNVLPVNSDHSNGHSVRLQRGGKYLSRFINNRFTVSSLHHQAVRRLGHTLKTSLVYRYITEEGFVYNLVEGVESSDGKIRGLQCHPEFRGYSNDGLLFSYLMHIDELIELKAEKLSDAELVEKYKSRIFDKPEFIIPESNRSIRLRLARLNYDEPEPIYSEEEYDY